MHSLRGRSVRTVAGVLGVGIILSAAPAVVHARLPAQAPGGPDPAESPRVDVTVGGDIGSHPTLSGDGRLMAYEGVVDLVEGDETARRPTVFLTDRLDGTTVELSPLPADRRPGATIRPVVSADGCTVAALSEVAFDVFRDDDEGARWDVYRTTLPPCGGIVGEWELVSTRAGATAVARNDVVLDPPAVSSGGTNIAYTHPADHLADAVGLTTISIVDLEIPADAPERSQLTAGLPVAAPNDVFVQVGLDQPALSPDGRHLAFRSDATSNEAVPQWGAGAVEGGPATTQVYVWDRTELDPFRAVVLVSARADGTPTERGAAAPVISRDGRVIAFVSSDTGLVAATFPTCDADCPTQVYRLDRDADGDGVLDDPAADGGRQLDLVSRDHAASTPVAGVAPSADPALSADGRQVAFTSVAPNLSAAPLAGGGGDGDGAVFVADARLGTLDRVSDVADPDGRGLAVYARPVLDDTARTLAFDTVATPELTPADVADARLTVTVTRAPSLSLADADLGTTRVGLRSDEWYLAVVNDGPSAFEPATVTIDDPHFAIDPERSTCTPGTVVPPGGDCTIRLSFTPSADVAFSAVLTVAEDGFGAVSVSSVVSGAGGEPALRAEPAGADLGRVVVGSPSTELHFDVANVSAFATSITSVVVSGEHAAEFAITTNNCAGRPLNPSVSCNVGVTFSPADDGRRTALVEVATPEGQYTSFVVAGDGAYEPKLAFLDPEVVAGRDLLAFGQGYPPDTDVVASVGGGREIVVNTNERGEFMVLVPVPLDSSGGAGAIVIESAEGIAASAPIEVIEEPQQLIGMPGFGLGGGGGGRGR